MAYFAADAICALVINSSSIVSALTFSDTITPALASQIRRMQDPRPILEAMGNQMVQIAHGSFKDPGMRATPWAPLKPATIKRKKGRGNILRFEGTLSRSFHLVNLTKSSVQVTSTQPYALPLQTGSKRGLPPRPMLPWVGGDPETAVLAPFAAEKIRAIGQAKMDSLLKGA